jgi:rhamnogalacturonan endolyase
VETDEAKLWAGAQYRQKRLAERWPYAWMQHEAFPVTRGTVTGILRFPDGRPVLNATVILSPPGTHWSAETRGYHFWARTEREGRFTIHHVREGVYTLTATGADQFHEFSRESVAVGAGQKTNLGRLTWQPVVHGRRIWQIGVADRTTGEFRNGDDYRHWGLWRRYPVQFPRGVHYVVGKSNERTDWNFAHWNWHSGDAAWTIAFDLTDPPRG